MTRHTLTLSRSNRTLAKTGVDKAPDGWVMELRAPTRSDDQNRALWSALTQIHRARPTHNGVKMTPDLWKTVFLHAYGMESVFLPALDGNGLFAAGFKSSTLTKGEFADLLTLILAWAAKEGIAVEHFDEVAA